MATLVEEQSFSGLIVEVKADDQGMTPQALKIQIFDENKEKRVDSPPPNMKEVSKAFELNCLAVPGQELREITNICKQESLKLSLNSDNKNSNCQTEKRGSNENYSISPTGKGTILSAIDKEALNARYEQFILHRKKQEEIKNKEKLKDMLITDLLSFSCLGLNFNSGHFPGEVAEEPLEVYNKASIEIGYKIHVHCKNDSLNDLDEYVFSMRKIGSYDYNDKYLVVQSPGVKSTYRIAMKVPNIKSLSQLEGSLVIFSDDCRGRVVMPIRSKIIMPYLYSERLLSKINESEGTLQFLIKNAHRQDLKVVLRNGSAKSVQADFALIADTYLSEHFDISFNPNIVHYPAGGLATLGLIIRRISVKALPKPPQNTMRCLIIARIKNCSAKFTFKCEFQWPVESSSSECFE